MKKSLIFLIVLFLFSLNFVVAEEVGPFTNPGQVTFNVQSSDISCYSSDTVAIWENSTSGTNETIFGEDITDGNCFEYSTYTGSSCCPTNYVCESQSSGVGICEPAFDPEPVLCGTINTEDMCNWNTANVDTSGEVLQITNGTLTCGTTSDEYTNPAGQICFTITDCSCGWAEDDDLCGITYRNTTVCDDGTGGTSTDSCTWIQESTDNQCDTTGKLIVEYSASGPSTLTTCVDKTVSYPCSASVKLPFFTAINFISVLLGIALIYYFFRKK